MAVDWRFRVVLSIGECPTRGASLSSVARSRARRADPPEAKIIAQVLNRLGYRTGQGQTWRVHHIYNVRYERRLPNYHKNGTWLTLQETARALQVSATVIKRLLKEGIVPAHQVVEGAPWVIERKNLELPLVQAHIQAVHAGRKPPRTDLKQPELSLK